MAGTATNAALWTGADVYIAPLATTEPINCIAAWSASWKAVGLLDGEEGFTIGRDEDSDEFYAWGGLLVRKTRSKHKRTLKFVAMEDPNLNFDLFTLVNPGSSTPTTALGVTTAVVKVPLGGYDFALGMEVRDGFKVKRRLVKRATIEEVGEVKESETDLAVYEITVAVYPESDGTLYRELSGSPTS